MPKIRKPFLRISKAFLRITDIEPQKRKGNRFSIFLDGKFAFGLSHLTLLDNNLKVGKNLKEEEITKIVAREELSKLTDLATNFLSYRPRSEKEISQYLTKKIAKRENIKYSEAKDSHLIEKVVSTLKKYKYINDFEFAKWYFESRLRSRPRGLMLIKLELKKKGVSDDIIENLLSGSASEIDLAKKALQKKIKRWQNLSPLDLKKKVYQHLSSRGFNFETIKESFALFAKKR